jgi:hypothetical protein
MTESLPSDPGRRGVEQGKPADLKGTVNAIEEILKGFGRWIEDNSGPIVELLRKAHHHLLFDKAGWIPHYSTPFSIVGDDIDAANLSALLDGYYRQNWPQVRGEFEARLIGLKVDAEAKATFSEALDAHGHGLYRVTARLLFPEIERVARTELLDGRLSGITSLKEVRDAVGELGLSELGPQGGGPVFAQFARMAHHLYETASTPERVAELASDPVPNRHAAIHGLVTYRTMQSSLNALIMTEFMYQAIPAAKASARDLGQS